MSTDAELDRKLARLGRRLQADRDGAGADDVATLDMEEAETVGEAGEENSDRDDPEESSGARSLRDRLAPLTWAYTTNIDGSKNPYAQVSSCGNFTICKFICRDTVRYLLSRRPARSTDMWIFVDAFDTAKAAQAAAEAIR